VKEHLNARDAWLAIGAFVLVYELACPKGELLSEGVDRALERHKYLTVGAIGVTALHLVNVLPSSVDPFHKFTELLK
jgi:hypothetical protein